MVFCCFGESLDEKEVSTLVADDALIETTKSKEHDNTDNRKKVSVIVPDGVYEGDAIMVRSPDGNQLKHAIVPLGCSPGQSFFVEFPRYIPEVINLADPPQTGCVSDIDRLLTPNPSIPEVLATNIVPEDGVVMEEGRRALDTINRTDEATRDSPEGEHPTGGMDPEEERQQQEPPATRSLVSMVSKALLLDDDDEDDIAPDLAQSPSAVTAPARLSTSRRPKRTTNKDQETNKQEVPEQKALKVRVPPGVQPGSTLYVEIPGENRTVAATVPEGVTSFHVCYIPRPLPLLAPPERRSLQAPRPEQSLQERSLDRYRPSRNVPTTMTAVPSISTPTGHQKLLLVRVPQGTKAGTTIHVSVPDEPGRILAAVVPAGNVPEFHISYESRMAIDAPPSPRSYLPPASPYRNHSMGDSELDSAHSSRRGRY